MLLLCQFYLTLPELQDVASGAESQPSSGTMEPDQCSTVQLLCSDKSTFLKGVVSICIASPHEY